MCACFLAFPKKTAPDDGVGPTPAPFLGHLLPTGGQEQAVPLPQRHWDKAQAGGLLPEWKWT